MATASYDPAIGTSIRGYRIERALGRGPSGAVYLTEQLERHRPAALKIFGRELGESADFRARFLPDCELAAGLGHPNVLPIYESGEADGVLYVAMRFVDGADLGSVLRGGPLSAEQTMTIVEQVAGGLHAAHCSGLVHRGVKPSNILLEADTHRVYVSDFGVGRTISELAYCAPERIEGNRLDGRADVYSLGCVLFHCLTGRPPAGHVPESAELGPELDRVLTTALARDPAARYTTTVELADACRRAMASRPAPARPPARSVPQELPPPPAPPEKGRSRRRRLILSVPALLLAAGVAAALAVSLGGGHRHRPLVAAPAPAPPFEPQVAASVRTTMIPLDESLAAFPGLPLQAPPTPLLYDYVAHSGGQGVRFRYTPKHWCGSGPGEPVPRTDPCWREVVPGTGAAEGQRLRIYCYARGANVRGDSWWVKVKVRPDEYVPATYLQTGRTASTATCL